jgi:ABC-type branched-subunit amino acid transport system ATPase component
VENLTLYYDTAQVLDRLSFDVGEGEMVSLVGPNGAGKTTALRAVAGLINWEKEITRGTRLAKITYEGSITFNGESIEHLEAAEIAKRGLSLCPERGRPFREMTVMDNLRVGAYLCKDKVETEKSGGVLNCSTLKQRMTQTSGTLSGGRAMLAVGRALMYRPRLLCIDDRRQVHHWSRELFQIKDIFAGDYHAGRAGRGVCICTGQPELCLSGGKSSLSAKPNCSQTKPSRKYIWVSEDSRRSIRFRRKGVVRAQACCKGVPVFKPSRERRSAVRKPRLGVSVLLATFFLCLVVFVPAEETSAAQVKVGIIGHMGFFPGDHVWRGAVVAAEEINKAGGVSGKTIELVKTHSNEMVNVPDAATAMEKLITVDKASVVIGGFRSESVLAMQDVACDYKTIFLGCTAHFKPFEKIAENYEKYKYYFRPYPNAAYMGATVADVTATVADVVRKELGVKTPKVAILAEKGMWVEPCQKT